MKHYDLALIGFGNVGRALARLLARKREVLADEFGLTFAITTIITGSHGSAHNLEGLDVEEALNLSAASKSLLGLSSQQLPNDTLGLIHSCGADVLFENSPVNYESGQPAIDHLRAALEQGMHAITANKGPLVHAHQELTDLAASVSRKFYFESTVMDGAPIFSLFRESLPGAKLIAFQGILNSTTNLMLARMEAGDSFDQAVAYAQSIGIAETDPSGDVDGWDAAIKVAALATVLMGISTKPSEVNRKGIREITPEMITQARKAGKRWKLVCSAERIGDKVETAVAPEMVSPGNLFYNIEGTTSIVRFDTDVLGKLSIIENDPGPETTAYGLLADFLNATKT